MGGYCALPSRDVENLVIFAIMKLFTMPVIARLALTRSLLGSGVGNVPEDLSAWAVQVAS